MKNVFGLELFFCNHVFHPEGVGINNFAIFGDRNGYPRDVELFHYVLYIAVDFQLRFLVSLGFFPARTVEEGDTCEKGQEN